MQSITWGTSNNDELKKYTCRKKIFCIHGKAITNEQIHNLIGCTSADFYEWTAFSSNPKYEEIIAATKQFLKGSYDVIIAIGGGSAIDIGKCVKAFCNMNLQSNCLKQDIHDNSVALIAIPTTAGSGSESTHFAVVYQEGRKYSVAHPMLLPDLVILEPSFLLTLTEYQRKSTVLDAICHAIESYWSKYATKESKKIAIKAIRILWHKKEDYFHDPIKYASDMLLAANLAGQAINITKTTAAHALSYILTTNYKISHGHAVALCLADVWKYIYLQATRQHKEDVIKTLDEISSALGFADSLTAICQWRQMVDEYGLKLNVQISEDIINDLSGSVNVERLVNSPIDLDFEAIKEIYISVLGGESLNECCDLWPGKMERYC